VRLAPVVPRSGRLIIWIRRVPRGWDVSRDDSAPACRLHADTRRGRASSSLESGITTAFSSVRTLQRQVSDSPASRDYPTISSRPLDPPRIVSAAESGSGPSFAASAQRANPWTWHRCEMRRPRQDVASAIPCSPGRLLSNRWPWPNLLASCCSVVPSTSRQIAATRCIRFTDVCSPSHSVLGAGVSGLK